jgi:hypothetical protein
MAEAAWQSLSLMRDGGPAILENKDALVKVMSKFVENECQDVGVRTSVKRIDAKDVDVYRLAFKCIFDSFIDVYETIRSDRFSRVFRLVKKQECYRGYLQTASV